jgi:hypothetical protein
MSDKFIIHYVSEERNRCLALCDEMDWSTGDDKEFLMHCIEYSVQPGEVEERRKRFNEMQPPTLEFDDEIEVDQEIEDMM